MQCFVIMPFDDPFEPVYETIVEAVPTRAGEAPLECYWLKDIHSAGRITDDLIHSLEQATLCIADVTGSNANVMWETGYAMALGKPTILLGQDIKSLPFDIGSHRVIEYDLTRLDALKPLLTKAVEATLARYELEPSASSPPLPERGRTIAVTGSTHADEAATRRRVESVLTPYISDSTIWLTGTVGTVDLSAIRFLTEHQQDVRAVGYHRYDYAPEVQQLVVDRQIGFIDASVEALPRGISGPSARDVLFCVRSDLVILFWDGKSAGIGTLIPFFQQKGVGTLLAHVTTSAPW